MESYEVKNLSFTYPNRDIKAIDDVNFVVNKGEFVLIFGNSGCGKTTLLRLLKPIISPFGKISGSIKFNDREIKDYSLKEQATKIGFVMQNADNQVVTDKVWHELSFGLENIGVPDYEIRTRVSEMAAFFGIDKWFHMDVSDLSGGQKQILNLASVMVMHPDVLILDEPTSQLDPIASVEFIGILERINKEFGTTIIISEHRLDEIFPVADKVMAMERGKIISLGRPREVYKELKEQKSNLCEAFPIPLRVYSEVDGGDDFPLSVRDGRRWLENYTTSAKIYKPEQNEGKVNVEVSLENKELWYRYEKNSPDIIKNLNLKVYKGEILSIFGGNGSGKSTLLSIIAGINKAYRGKVVLKQSVGMLPQNPQCLFLKNTVLKDLLDIAPMEKVEEVARLCRISDLFECHPYDLSGGEQQRLGLCKVLLKNPDILLLDEPTKGFDGEFKNTFAEILVKLKRDRKTVVMVSHDVEFCARISDRCAMLFDGGIVSVDNTQSFFKNNTFYTTGLRRMSKGIIDDVILFEDLLYALKGVNKNE